MKTFIFLFALLTTISNFFASTLEFKFGHIVTAFTFTLTTWQKVPFFEFLNSLYNNKLIFFKLEIAELGFLIFDLFPQKLDFVIIRIYFSRLVFDMFMNLFNCCASHFPYSHFFGKRIPLFGSYLLQQILYGALFSSLNWVNLKFISRKWSSIDCSKMLMCYYYVSEIL